MDAKKTTEAQQFVIERLRGMVGGKQPYRTGALVLSYPATEPGQDCRIAGKGAVSRSGVIFERMRGPLPSRSSELSCGFEHEGTSDTHQYLLLTAFFGGGELFEGCFFLGGEADVHFEPRAAASVLVVVGRRCDAGGQCPADGGREGLEHHDDRRTSEQLEDLCELECRFG